MLAGRTGSEEGRALSNIKSPSSPSSPPSHVVASLLRHSHTNVRNGETFLQLGGPSEPTGWGHRALKEGEGLLSHPSIQTGGMKPGPC